MSPDPAVCSGSITSRPSTLDRPAHDALNALSAVGQWAGIDRQYYRDCVGSWYKSERASLPLPAYWNAFASALLAVAAVPMPQRYAGLLDLLGRMGEIFQGRFLQAGWQGTPMPEDFWRLRDQAIAALDAVKADRVSVSVLAEEPSCECNGRLAGVTACLAEQRAVFGRV